MDSALLQFGYRHFLIEVPTNWDELTPEQYERIQFLKCTTTDRKAMLFEMLMALVPLKKEHLLELFGLMLTQHKWLSALNCASMFVFFDSRKLWKFFATDDVIDALPSIEWVFDAKSRQNTSQIQEFSINAQTYYGPRDSSMSGVAWKQMQHADQLLSNFTNTKDEDWLTHLAAVLYLPKGERFTTEDDSIEDRVALFAHLRIQLKYAIYCNYVQIREAFYRGFTLPQGSGRPDWKEVSLSVAELGALGTFNQVGESDAHTVMKYFAKKHKDNKPEK